MPAIHEISECSIVMLGKFNPAIFQPAWLEAMGVEAKFNDEIDTLNVIHNDYSSYKVGGREYSVQRDRFMVKTSSAPWIQIMDVATKVFGELLSHTPIHAFGVNFTQHYSLESFEKRKALGRLLAPIEPWGDFGNLMDVDDPKMVGGLLSLNMQFQEELEGCNVRVNSRVGPSSQLTSDVGVEMEINSHFALADYEVISGTAPSIQILTREFENRVAASEKIIQHVVNLS